MSKYYTGSKVLKRDLPIYTYLDKIQDVKEAQQLFLAECESRKKVNKLIDDFKVSYIDKELNFLSNIKLEHQTKDIVDINKIIENYREKITNNNIEAREDKYLLLLLAGFSYRSFDEQYNHIQDVVSIDFYIDIKNELYAKLNDEKILDFIYNTIEDNHKIDFSIFYFMLKSSKKFSKEIDEFITTKKKNYIDYRLIHTTHYKSYKEAPYIQIDLALKDDEILKQIKAIKQSYDDISYLAAINKKKPKAITKSIEYANILFSYDCRKLNYPVRYIESEIQQYCVLINEDYYISNSKYKEYISTAKKFIEN